MVVSIPLWLFQTQTGPWTQHQELHELGGLSSARLSRGKMGELEVVSGGPPQLVTG